MWRKIAGILGVLVFLAALAGGSYFYGKRDGTNISTTAISEYKSEVQRLKSDLAGEQKSDDVRILTEYMNDTQYIEKIVTRNKVVIKDKLIPTSKLSKGFVYTYNQTVLNLPADPVLATDASLSDISDTDALPVLLENVATANASIVHINKLQDWIMSTVENANEVSGIGEKSE